MRRTTDHFKLPRLDIPGKNESSASKTAERPLHLCPRCGSSLVHPIRWQQGDQRGQWRVWRRCPECEWSGNGLHDEPAIDAYDEQLDNGVLELAQELRALQHTNMRELADVFVAALRQDLIGADDFARPR